MERERVLFNTVLNLKLGSILFVLYLSLEF